MCCDIFQTVLYIVVIASNSGYGLAAPFLPILFADKYISGAWVGLMFAMYSLTIVLTSPIIGKIVDNVGHSNLLTLGLIGMGISVTPFGLLKECESNTSVIAAAIMLRALQGASSATINTCCFTLAANKYPQ